MIAAAAKIESIKAVATIGAPADPQHVTHLFNEDLEKIEEEGRAEVNLAGRSFTIGKRFITDLKGHDQVSIIKALRDVDVLIMHSPEDSVVNIENAGIIYSALSHPKSFVSLAKADHLLTKAEDAEYVVDLIRAWVKRVI